MAGPPAHDDYTVQLSGFDIGSATAPGGSPIKATLTFQIALARLTGWMENRQVLLAAGTAMPATGTIRITAGYGGINKSVVVTVR
jgi:hypothetical protein